MASNQIFAALTIAAIFVLLPAFALGVEYKVGDDSGWTNNFNYTAWASDKEFHVGDKLVFIYPQGKHNVFKVNGAGFKDCVIPPANEALTTGNDVIPLATAGRKWYICGVASHCATAGQKLAITVLPAEAASPSPWSPSAQTPGSPNSAYGTIATGYQALVAAVVAAAMVALV